MKTVSSSLRDHMIQQVTTLCTCLVIRRRDGRSFHFTDHDEPVRYANQYHVPYNSFARFSITSTIDLEVDNLEIRGMISAGAITRDDIAGGLLDWSDINVFAVNWFHPEQGRVMLRSGHLGEFTMDEDGTFHAEIRGMSQVYSTKIGEVYQAECRADLGDSRCQVALDPSEWAPTTSYCAGQIIKAPIDPALGYVNLGLTNKSFEDDGSVSDVTTLTGWTTYGDTTNCAWGAFHDNASFGGVPAPKIGSYFAGHINHTDPLTTITAHGTDLGMYQDIDLVGAGISTGDLDTGLCRIVATLWYARANSSNTAPTFRIFAQDASGTQLGVVYDSGGLGGAEDTWQRLYVNNVLIPIGTRILRVDLFSHKQSGNLCGSAFDSVSVSVNTPSGTLGSSDQYGGVSFKALNAGTSGATMPAFTNLDGATTIDNDITWKTSASGVSQVATVLTVTNAKSIAPTALTGGAGYYDGGLLTWETGFNAGKTQEVYAWDGANIQFFIRPFYLPQVGDRFAIHPGCDKTRSTCASKFDNTINFRGEPDVPGMDDYMKTPNAGGGTQFFISAGGTPT